MVGLLLLTSQSTSSPTSILSICVALTEAPASFWLLVEEDEVTVAEAAEVADRLANGIAVTVDEVEEGDPWDLFNNLLPTYTDTLGLNEDPEAAAEAAAGAGQCLLLQVLRTESA